jgi:hypothetical protein
MIDMSYLIGFLGILQALLWSYLITRRIIYVKDRDIAP